MKWPGAANWRDHIPYLDAWIDIGLLQMQTAVWRVDRYADNTLEYLVLEVRVLRRWGFRFRLYDTLRRKRERGSL